jgi:cyclopropane fatty-acyl-phospholipid synthase-like methyltransferase
MKTLYLAILAGTLAWSAAAAAAELRVGTADTIESVLRAQKGRVTVRLRSGQELTGNVRSVDVRLLHLGSLTGREFFDAVVPMEAIEAVIVRTKE